jgi:hypothetical protein
MSIFIGLFASVERGVTRYDILQSIRSLQSHLRSPSSSEFTQFTTLQPCIAYSNSALRRIRPGAVLEPYYRPFKSTSSPSPSITSNRLRTLFSNFPHSINKHFLPNYQQSSLIKKQISSNNYFEFKTNLHDEIFTLKSDSSGRFVPIYKQLPSINSNYRSSYLLNQIQGLYTPNLLSKLTNQYPLITELIISRTLEENIPTTDGYPFRRITLHRFVENHPRIIAFDMKNYAFIEIDARNSIDMYAIEHNQILFQRYQAQLRWCHQHLSSFVSQIKTILHSSNGTLMFIQATPFHGQQFQQYHQRQISLSNISSPLVKHIPQTIFTSQESLSSSRLRSHTPLSSKFYTTSNNLKYEQKRDKSKTNGSNTIIRKDVRIYFNDSTVQKNVIFNDKHSNNRLNSTEIESINGDEENENENSFQCTAL